MVFVCYLADKSFAQERIALLIGNQGYTDKVGWRSVSVVTRQ